MEIGASKPRRWDFFISYTQADRAWAEWIAWVLEEDGYEVLVQAWDFVGGSNWIQEMQTGVSQSDRTIAVLSLDYLVSDFSNAEWRAAWAADPSGEQRKLLVTRVRECPQPGFLAGVGSVDLFGKSEATAKVALRNMVSSAVLGRAKPAKPPRFPGEGRTVTVEPQFPGMLPRIWNVPLRSPNFIGRDLDLVSLGEALASGSAVTVQSVRGMGGIGKSQLATEYCYLHSGDYDLVFWIAAEESASIPDQFARLAASLGLDSVPEPEALRVRVHDRLRAVPGWLLVFDNADNAEDIRRWLPCGPLPRGVPGHVIVTTRRGGFSALGPVLELDVISLSDALRLLRTRVPHLDESTGKMIAEELGCLPLALEQAAAYLDRTSIPAAEYLDLLRKRAADLYLRGQPTGRKDTIATLWDISIEQIRSEMPAAVTLLDLCAYLAPEPIPLNLFTGPTELLPEPLSSAADDELAFGETIGTLVDYSLLKRAPDGLQLHRLVQGAIRARHSYSARQPSRRRIPISARSASSSADDALNVVLGLLQAAAPEQIMGAPQAWPRWAVLLPHVLAATSYLSNSSVPPDSAAWAYAAWLLDRSATYLQIRGDPADARLLAERALAIDQATLGPEHPNVATDLNNLALILRDLGQAAAARPLAERAMGITMAAYGPDHPDVATRLNNLALILRDLGQAAAARPLAERALAIDEAALGPDHPCVATRLSNLALILRDLRQAADARILAERALAITMTTLGPDHPDVAIDLGSLALIMRDMGKVADARLLAERAVAIDRTALGPDHPYAATHLGNLASILRDLGQAADARPLAERALAITETARGSGHPDTASRLNNLAIILRDLGKASDARLLAERALAIDQLIPKPDDPGYAISLDDLTFTSDEHRSTKDRWTRDRQPRARRRPDVSA